MRKLPRKFFNRPTIEVAIDLLGCRLVSHIGGVKTGGTIVETEAYIGEDDPACHASRGPTRRNRVMYGPPGYLYVYFTYGNHFMANIVTETESFPAAVLLRGIEPLYDLGTMSRRRKTKDLFNIASGPGKLTRALGLTTGHNGTDLKGDTVFVSGPSDNTGRIMASPRIGIGQGGSEKLWRFYLENNPHVSRGSAYNKRHCYDLEYAGNINFSIESESTID